MSVQYYSKNVYGGTPAEVHEKWLEQNASRSNNSSPTTVSGNSNVFYADSPSYGMNHCSPAPNYYSGNRGDPAHCGAMTATCYGN